MSSSPAADGSPESAATQPQAAAADSISTANATATPAPVAPITDEHVADAVSSSSPSAAAVTSSVPSSTSSDSATAASKQPETRTIHLSGDQLHYLELMRDRYNLGSMDKALRCLVNYARQDGDQRFIFATYRCRHCGIKFDKKATEFTLYKHQWEFLDRMKEQYGVRDPQENGKVVRVLLDFTQEGRCKRGMNDAQRAEVLNALEKTIYEVIRCNDPVCTHKH